MICHCLPACTPYAFDRIDGGLSKQFEIPTGSRSRVDPFYVNSLGFFVWICPVSVRYEIGQPVECGSETKETAMKEEMHALHLVWRG